MNIQEIHQSAFDLLKKTFDGQEINVPKAFTNIKALFKINGVNDDGVRKKVLWLALTIGSTKPTKSMLISVDVLSTETGTFPQEPTEDFVGKIQKVLQVEVFKADEDDKKVFSFRRLAFICSHSDLYTLEQKIASTYLNLLK